MLPNQPPAAAPEIVALTSAIVDVIVAAKQTGSTALGDAQAALPDLLAAMQGIGNIAADIKKPENQTFILWGIAQALEPKA